MSLAKRVREAREAAGYTQAQLAELIKVKQQSIQQIENGDTLRPRKINELAGILGVPVDYLISDDEDLDTIQYPIIPRCPLVSWEDAIFWPYNKKELKESAKLQHPASEVILNGKCYMLQIEDDSMINYLEGGKGFHKGKYIVINPSLKPSNDSYVIARKEGFPKVLFRQYIEDMDGAYLNPLNISKYKRIDLNSEIKITGIVVAYLDLFL